MSTLHRRKLHNSLQGVLAAGGVPTSAPLLSFTPFVWFVIAAGAAGAVAGASLWLAALTLLAAAAVHGVVISQMRDRRGGNSLSEEEFGGWAIKVNGAVTFVLYVTAFLASLSAALTLMADRVPALDRVLWLGVSPRDLLGIALAAGVGWLVNNRPRRIAYLYGPVTGALLALLWGLVVAVLARPGAASLPLFSSAAFDSLQSVELVVASLARLLAIVAGIEVFATLEPVFTGSEAQRRRKALGSMAMVVTTSLAMLLVFGPAAVHLTDPAVAVSPVTQAMQQLLPAPLAWLGTAIAMLALLSVAAASAQALQNLNLGLRNRRYAPAFLAQRNRADVPDWPVRIVLALTTACFILLGAREEVYLPIYVAGSLLLLVMISWAAWRRARRELRLKRHPVVWLLALFTLAIASFLSVVSIAVALDGFLRGAWIYLLAVPVLYAVFHFTRRKMGSPNPLQEELGRREEAMRGLARPIAVGQSVRVRLPSPEMAPADDATDRGAAARWQEQTVAVDQIAVALDGSDFAERALPAAAAISRLFDATLTLISVLPARGALRVLPKGRSSGNPLEAGQAEIETYLSRLADVYRSQGVNAEYYVAAGPVAQAIDVLTRELDVDLLIMSTHGRSGISRFMLGSNASAVIQLLRRPVLLLRPQSLSQGDLPTVRRVLVTLDGSAFAERVLPWVQRVSQATGAQVLLLAVPEVPEPALYGAMAGAVDELREQAEANAQRYLERVAAQLLAEGMPVQPLIEGSRPATTILDVAEREHVELIMLATHGRGGMERLMLGSVADRVVHHSRCPILLVPAREGDT